ncbi:MAG: hypothetical protein BM485_16155 [Desulfobulbaceae bacterium DB1]|nr:MAG: hypothetical protein BM485_16155 [Desulfobulbaceae bacterium DB1]
MERCRGSNWCGEKFGENHEALKNIPELFALEVAGRFWEWKAQIVKLREEGRIAGSALPRAGIGKSFNRRFF